MLTLCAMIVLAGGCSRGAPPPGDESTASPAPTASSPDAPDTSRAGPAFLAVYREGPLDELRVVRATDGGLVVAGMCEFSDGTVVTITLLARNPTGDPESIASVRAAVDEGRFMGAPLAGVAGPPPAGTHLLRVFTSFGPGEQTPAVLSAADRGRRHRGPGMRTLADGRIIFETLLEVPL